MKSLVSFLHRETQTHSGVPDAQICPGTAKVFSKCVGKNKVLVTVLEPNNVVTYKGDGVRVYGMVQQIYEMNAPDGKVDVWIQSKELNNTFQKPSNFTTPLLRFQQYPSRMRLVVGTFSIPEPTHIKASRIELTAAHCLLPSQTFGLHSQAIIQRTVDRYPYTLAA
ncbi:hypothetical protein PSHT_15853 [Puccinia striiformis]|uniref:Uncharacterized protein n=1 Tax=Puccinia striiformis TaxID=27350 RepID=A0A2S4UCZ1_9BASI|nr:hypothetical protein PSHT_15853 [Puccinia striiformis]